MPLYRCTIYKQLTALNGEKWVNSYYINDTSAELALDRADDIADIEAAVLPQAVSLYRLTAKPMAGGDTTIRAISKIGEIDTDPVNLVPFFNTVRVILTDNVGRVESKYLRACIAEPNVNGFNISSELLAAMQDNYLTPLLGILTLRGPNNEPITGGSVQQLIQMRQISWHRRTRVGFHRGWVPDV